MATPAGVIDWDTGDGDGGLFKGILARYLAEVAVRLPAYSPANRATRKLAARLVMASANSVWEHRLEVDGLPIFGTDWTADARLPHNYGVGASSLGEKVGVIRIAERDLFRRLYEATCCNRNQRERSKARTSLMLLAVPSNRKCE